MISINANALKLTLAKLQTTRKSVVKQGDAGFRQKIYYLWDAALRVSPQFTGNFVSNWFLSVDGNLGSYKPYQGTNGATMREKSYSNERVYKIAPRQAGDMEAIISVRAAGLARLNGVTMKSRVRFINLTDMYTDGTSMISPRDAVPLRPENVVPGNQRIESYLRALAKNPIPLKATP